MLELIHHIEHGDGDGDALVVVINKILTHVLMRCGGGLARCGDGDGDGEHGVGDGDGGHGDGIMVVMEIVIDGDGDGDGEIVLLKECKMELCDIITSHL